MNTHLSKALVILSGGQDSTTCLFWAKRNFNEVSAITFDYGQRHVIEIDAAVKVAKMAGVGNHEIIKVPNCLISMSPLTSGAHLEQYETVEQMESTIGSRRELTFVPMRNALFLTIAANRAEALGIPNLVTGVCQMDNANYDDCRQIFITATEDYINRALGHDHRGTVPIRILTPLMNLSKAQTVEMAYEMPDCWAALAYSHTSYDGKFPPTDHNHANMLRADGFEKAGLPDPLVLRAFNEGLMALPATSNYDGGQHQITMGANLFPNSQPIEKQVAGDGQTLEVHSVFYTIQGEGPHCGKPAVFIRLAGCNLQCPGCDTEYSADRETLTVQEIIDRVEQSFEDISAYSHFPIIVITGGEPFRQNIAVLAQKLARDYNVQIETNGTLGIDNSEPFEYVDIVCSPKTGKVHPSIVAHAKWFKYVLHHAAVSNKDGLPIFALGHSASPQVFRPPVGTPIYLQPMDCKDPVENKLNQDAVLASCLKFGHTLQLQLHKILEVE